MGSEHPTGERDKSDPQREDLAPSVVIFMQVFCLFLKYCRDPIGKSGTFLCDSLFGGYSFESEFLERSRINLAWKQLPGPP